jgi:hypothetical protein
MSQVETTTKSNTRSGNKLKLSRSDKIDISKLFTREFFDFMGIDDVHIHKVAVPVLSVETFDLKPSSDVVQDDSRNRDPSSPALVGVETFTMPEPSSQHADIPLTKASDFEIQRPIEPGQIMKGGGMLNDIGSFFSSFLYRTSKPTTNHHPLKPDAMNNPGLELTFGKGATLHSHAIIPLSSIKPDTSKVESIYRLNILGGIEYSDLETLSLCIDRQNEYMEKMGLQINAWRLDYVYKIHDTYVCFDVENISEIDDIGNSDKSMNDRKKEFMNMIIGDEYSKLKGTREGMRLV